MSDDLHPDLITIPASRDGGAISFHAGQGRHPADSLGNGDLDNLAPFPLIFGVGLPVEPGEEGAPCQISVGPVLRRFREALYLAPNGVIRIWGVPNGRPPRSKRRRIRCKWAKQAEPTIVLWGALRAFMVECIRQSRDWGAFGVHRLTYVTGGGWHGGKAGSICFGDALRFDGDGKTRVNGKVVDAGEAYEALWVWVFGEPST